MLQQLSVSEYKQWLDEKKSGYTLLDVREPWEIETCSMEDIISIPMGQVPNRLDELDREKPVVVVCHHGVRSQRVALFLEHSGYEAIYNLSGGVNAWAKEIDTTFPTY